jgi:hypothetical protein
VAEDRTVGALAILPKVLRDHRRDCRSYSNEAVLVNTDPYDIEPCQTTFRNPPGSFHLPIPPTATPLEPGKRPEPVSDRPHLAEILLLLVQIGRHIVAEESEEGGNGKGLVAVADDAEVDEVPIVADAEPRGRRVDGHHKKDADDVLLLSRFRVVDCVHEDEEEGHYDCEGGAGAAEDEGEVMEGQVANYLLLGGRKDCRKARGVS